MRSYKGGTFAARLLVFVCFAILSCYAVPRSLTVSPTSISFGSVALNSVLSRTVTAQNTGALSVTVSSTTLSAAGFATSGLALPITLPPGQSLTFQVLYAPTNVGSNTATLYLRKPNGGVLASVALNGSALATAQAADTAPPIVVVTSPANAAVLSGTVTLSASASDNVGVTDVQFYVGSTAIGPLLTAAPYSFSWDTTTVSNGYGYVISAIAWDAAGNRTQSTGVTASVSNVVPAQHSATLSWAPSPSAIVGYYVYRSTQSGGPYVRMTGTPNASTSFTDTSVTGGGIYYYVVTAVDATGIESIYSNQTTAQIPY